MAQAQWTDTQHSHTSICSRPTRDALRLRYPVLRNMNFTVDEASFLAPPLIQERTSILPERRRQSRLGSTQEPIHSLSGSTWERRTRTGDGIKNPQRDADVSPNDRSISSYAEPQVNETVDAQHNDHPNNRYWTIDPQSSSHDGTTGQNGTHREDIFSRNRALVDALAGDISTQTEAPRDCSTIGFLRHPIEQDRGLFPGVANYPSWAPALLPIWLPLPTPITQHHHYTYCNYFNNSGSGSELLSQNHATGQGEIQHEIELQEREFMQGVPWPYEADNASGMVHEFQQPDHVAPPIDLSNLDEFEEPERIEGPPAVIFRWPHPPREHPDRVKRVRSWHSA